MFLVQIESLHTNEIPLKIRKRDWNLSVLLNSFANSKPKSIPQLDKILPVLANQKIPSDALPKQNRVFLAQLYFY